MVEAALPMCALDSVEKSAVPALVAVKDELIAKTLDRGLKRPHESANSAMTLDRGRKRPHESAVAAMENEVNNANQIAIAPAYGHRSGHHRQNEKPPQQPGSESGWL